MSNPNEYFCYDCGQLRLLFINNKTGCGNCGSDNIISGKPGELDKAKLKKEYHESRNRKKVL